ncbi:allergin-1 isoform X2 [Mixophyes fleayi]|uniref:allergin-1 isoform X2 n=1 Tax=Mixophyes fleayi TaxID=3061075 RepID=UPI003F4D9DE7
MVPLLLLCLMSWTAQRAESSHNDKERLTNPELIPVSTSTETGNTETITCLSTNGSLPINYTLFLNMTSKGTVSAANERGATFNITISNQASLGPYKCKADNGHSNSTYSKEFTFTLYERLTRPELIPVSQNTVIGNTKIITCLSKNGSLPIIYTLFHNMTSKGTVTAANERGATFYITISNQANLGPYKCKADNGYPTSTYSKEFTFTLLEMLPNPQLISVSMSTAIGNTETITCLSTNGSLPINYTLIHNMISKGTVTATKEGGATFNITISNQTSLGPYKCKADNGHPNSTYSKEFTFTLHGQQHFLVWLIPVLLLILFLLLAIVLFKIIKHRKEMGVEKGRKYCILQWSGGNREETDLRVARDTMYFILQWCIKNTIEI